MEAKYGESGLEALRAATGLDHLDVIYLFNFYKVTGEAGE